MYYVYRCSDAHHFPNPSEHSTENCYCGDSYLQTSSYCMSQIWIIGLALGSAIILLVFLLIVIICLAVSRSKLKGKQNGDDEKVTCISRSCLLLFEYNITTQIQHCTVTLFNLETILKGHAQV